MHSVSNTYQKSREDGSCKAAHKAALKPGVCFSALKISLFSLSCFKAEYVPELRLKEEGNIPLKTSQTVQEEGNTQNIY